MRDPTAKLGLITFETYHDNRRRLQAVEILTFIPSHRDTALSGRKARSVRRARKAPILPRPIPSAPRLISDIWNDNPYWNVSKEVSKSLMR